MSDLDGIYPPDEGDVTLPSGVVATIRIPRPKDYIRAGGIPLGSLSKLESAVSTGNGNGPDLSLEEIDQSVRFNDALVRISVKALNGKPVSLSDEDMGRIPQDDYMVIVSYALRTETLPLAEATT